MQEKNLRLYLHASLKHQNKVFGVFADNCGAHESWNRWLDGYTVTRKHNQDMKFRYNASMKITNGKYFMDTYEELHKKINVF